MNGHFVGRNEHRPRAKFMLQAQQTFDQRSSGKQAAKLFTSRPGSDNGMRAANTRLG
jgi:hypothetical protein